MSPLAPGFLVAAPPSNDPNFERSVVLLATHSEEGAFGWVVNGRDVMTVEELIGRSEGWSDASPPEPGSIGGKVRLGGPVGQEQVWMVYRSEDRLEDCDEQFEVGPGLVASPSRKVLEALVEGRRMRDLFGVLGYAGWAPEQLEEEIRRGAWLPIDCDPELVFEVGRDEMWERAFGRVGASPMAFTTRTVGSA